MSSFVSLAFHLEIVLSPYVLQVVFFASEAIITRFFKHRRATFSHQRQKKHVNIRCLRQKNDYQVSETHHRLELQLDDVSMSESPESEQAARGISSILVFSIIFLAIMDHGDLDHGFTVEITKKNTTNPIPCFI